MGKVQTVTSMHNPNAFHLKFLEPWKYTAKLATINTVQPWRLTYFSYYNFHIPFPTSSVFMTWEHYRDIIQLQLKQVFVGRLLCTVLFL